MKSSTLQQVHTHLERVRKYALALPDTSERLSHGEPTFFAKKKVFVMFSNNHHNDGHVAIIVPTPPTVQQTLIAAKPHAYYYPAYVGSKGWVGIELSEVDDATLRGFIDEAWKLVMG